MSIRPTHAEKDEDLLRQQQEFLRKKEKPGVNIIKNSDTIPRQTNDDACGNSGQHISDKQKPTPTMAGDSSASTVPSSKADTSLSGTEDIPLNSSSSPKPLLTDSQLPLNASKGTNAGLPKKKSLFALRMEKSRSDVKKNPNSVAFHLPLLESESKFGERSYIISGKEGEEIHKQNVAELEKLSIQEIEEERQRLMSQLSSSTIKFLQSRRKAHQAKQLENNFEGKIQNKTQLSTEPIKIKEDVDKIRENVGDKNKVFSSSFTSMQNNDQMRSTENYEDVTLPISLNETKQWLHMDVIEKDKLEWMKDLPPFKSSPGPDQPYAARFDFQGLLLPYCDEKVEVNTGLHHHGDEPERPGYTLQELMQLSRSSVQQQRIMGLNTLGNVLIKAKLGIYDKVLQQNIVKELLDAGIFLLLRFSMDDLSPPVVVAALTTIRNLLFNEPDEASLDYILGCEGGLQNPCLEVPYEESEAKKIQEQKDHEAGLKDFEIIQLDVLKGAERTNLIVRLGYILDVLKGPPDIVLDVLLRIVRHSKQLAESVVCCGGLLRTIRDQLLTTHVIPSLAAGCGHSGYGEPSSKALRLMRVLAAQSRTIANTLLDKFNIMEPIMTYVSMSSPELPHIQGLVIHGFYLWQTFMSYGLASQTVLDLFPILMRQLHFHVQHTSATGDEASPSGHELATALIGVIERACEIIASEDSASALDCKPVFQLVKLVGDCLHKWLMQLSQSTDTPSWSCVKMVGSALNCWAAAGNCAKRHFVPESRSIIEKLEALVYKSVFPFLSNSCFKKLIDNLIPSSYFLSSVEAGTKRDPPNLPSIGAMMWSGESLLPGLLPKAPHPLLSGLLRFIGASSKILESLGAKFQSLLLNTDAVEKYIQALILKSPCSPSQWFCRQEIYMLHHLVTLVALEPSLISCENQAKYSQLAFRVVELVQANDKYLIPNVLSSIIFNPEFIRRGINVLSFEENHQNLLENSLARLPSIGSLYLNVLGVCLSSAPRPAQRTSLTSLPQGTEPALPVDWHFAPLLILYGQYNAQNRARCLEPGTVLMVKDTLQFLYLVEVLWPQTRRPLTVTARWCRLSLVFLAGSDLFLDDDIKIFLKANLDQLLIEHKQLDFSESIPGLSSFYDLYGELLLQFSAVSYGDRLFGAFLLHPLQQRQDLQLRRMVWGENSVVIHALSTSIDEVGIPMEDFLEPCETDPILLTHYLESVARGKIVEKRSPVLFQVAVHHVALFIQLYKEDALAVSFHKRIHQLKDKDIRELFLKYAGSRSEQKTNGNLPKPIEIPKKNCDNE